MKLFLIPLFLITAQVGHACPSISDRVEERVTLLEQLKTADTYTKGRTAIAGMWMFWRMAPDETAQEMLDNGLSNIRIADFKQAEDSLSRLVEYCPDYAEGHNQLAFAYFLQGKYDLAHTHLKRALELEPSHFGALSGIALTYQAEGREDIAQIFLRRALAVNPWLNERHLLRPAKNSNDL